MTAILGWDPLRACVDAGELLITGESGLETSLHVDGAWDATNAHVLWLRGEGAVRGQNVVISGAEGQLGEPWRTDQSTYGLEMLVDGSNDVDGNPYASYLEGLEANLTFLEEEFCLNPSQVTSYPARLVMPSGAVRTADVQPRSLLAGPSDGLGVVRAVLTLVVLGGRFVEQSS